VAVSRQPCGKTIDNSRCLQGPLVLDLSAVGHNVVAPRLVAACDERHACRRVIVLAIVGSLVAAPWGCGRHRTGVYDGRRQQYAAEVRTEHAPDPIAHSRAKAVVVSAVWAIDENNRLDPLTSRARVLAPTGLSVS
jgi:hypothetical protein